MNELGLYFNVVNNFGIFGIIGLLFDLMIMVIDGGLIDNLRFNEFFGLIMLNGGLISISVFDSVMIFVIDKIGLFVLVIVG